MELIPAALGIVLLGVYIFLIQKVNAWLFLKRRTSAFWVFLSNGAVFALVLAIQNIFLLSFSGAIHSGYYAGIFEWIILTISGSVFSAVFTTWMYCLRRA